MRVFDCKATAPYATRFQLVSLLEMIEFSANEYLKVISALEQLTAIFEVRTADLLELASGQKGNIIKPFREFIEYAERMKLSHSAAFARETCKKSWIAPPF